MARTARTSDTQFMVEEKLDYAVYWMQKICSAPDTQLLKEELYYAGLTSTVAFDSPRNPGL